MSRFNYLLVYKKGTQMHVADPLSCHSDHYVHSSEDNKAQTLLKPNAIQMLDVTSSSHDECQQLVTQFHDLHCWSQGGESYLQRHV